MQLTEELQHLRRELEDLKLKETNLEIRTDIRLDAIEQRIERCLRPSINLPKSKLSLWRPRLPSRQRCLAPMSLRPSQ